ncbi:MAG: pyruvate dehydrogenase complex dihydrolipoamide acetyltransferase [Pseudomonadota bacterium]
MAIEILMPALSPTMEEGTLAKWLVAEGDEVSSGDLLAEIETDKATMEFEAVDEGVIGKILVAEGTEGVAVNTAIAVLLEDGESADDVSSAAAAHTPTAKAPEAAPAPAVAPSTATAPSSDKGARVFATPLARRIAADKGVDLASVTGSGPHGRIVKADVEGAQPGAAKPAAAAPASTTTATPAPQAAAPQSASADQVARMYEGREYEEIMLDGMRKTIAARLTEAKQTIPHFYLRRSVKLDPLLAFRVQLNGQLADSGVKLSVNDFIIKAGAKALQDVPDANAVWAGDRVLKMKASDVAVAVAIEGGLFTPVIKDADTKTLSTISAEMKDLAARARDRKLAPHEYQGGSFAVSNLGMFGIENFDAVINPPHGSILAVGAGVKTPVVAEDGAVSVATVMSVTLSVDHRVIDGALGAQWVTAFVGYMENPITMLV